MKLEIQNFKKSDVAYCIVFSLLFILIAFISAACDMPGVAIAWVGFALLTMGLYVYTYVTTPNFSIDPQGIHILRGKKEVNFLPWNLVKTIGYQRDGGRKYIDLVYVSLADASRTRQPAKTAQLYGGLLGSPGLTLNHVLLRKQENLDVTKLGAKLLVLGPDMTMKHFTRLCQLQIASIEIYGGKAAESCIDLKATKAWPEN